MPVGKDQCSGTNGHDDRVNGRDKLNDLLMEVFLIEEDEVTDDLRRADLDTWDSLGTVSLAVGVEEVFGYHIDPGASNRARVGRRPGRAAAGDRGRDRVRPERLDVVFLRRALLPPCVTWASGAVASSVRAELGLDPVDPGPLPAETRTLVACGGGTLIDRAKALSKSRTAPTHVVAVPTLWGAGAEAA